jgi:chorismate mutase
MTLPSNTSSTDTAHLGSGTDEVTSLVGTLREDLDYLDRQIMEMVVKRRAISNMVQSIKIARGLPRTDLKREQEIVANYRRILGPLGDDLAAAILKPLAKD